MNELTVVNELFSGQEMMVLAAGCGMETFRMVSEEKPEIPDPVELNKAIFELYRRKILCWDGKDGYIMRPDIQSLFREIKYAEKELEIRSNKQKTLLHCFCGKDVVVMELSQNDTDRIKVHKVRRNDFAAELCDRHFFHFYVSGEQGENEEKNIWKKFREENPKMIPQNIKHLDMMREILNNAGSVSCYAILYDREKKQNVSVWVFLDDGTQGCMAVFDDKKDEAEILTEKNIEKLFYVRQPWEE